MFDFLWGNTLSVVLYGENKMVAIHSALHIYLSAGMGVFQCVRQEIADDLVHVLRLIVDDL